MYWNQNIGDPIFMWILNTILMFVLIYSGYGITYKNKSKFSSYAGLSLLFYSLIEGLRWMRGVDYFHYYQDLATGFKGSYVTGNPEILYELFCKTFHSLGWPVPLAFIFYSFLLLFSFILVLRHFRDTAIFALPLFYVMTVSATENHIRQFLAISFVFFAYDAYLCNKRKRSYFLLCLSAFIHSSLLVVFPFYILLTLKKVNLPNKGVYYILFAYILLFFFWDIRYLGNFANWLQIVGAGDNTKFSGYTEDADRWFTSEGSMSGRGLIASQSVFYIWGQFLISLILIYFGYLLAKRNKDLLLVFSFTCISLFIDVLGSDIELLGRFSECFSYFSPLLLALVLRDKSLSKNIRYALYIIVFFIYGYMGFIRPWGNPTLTGSAFIWDA